MDSRLVFILLGISVSVSCWPSKSSNLVIEDHKGLDEDVKILWKHILNNDISIPEREGKRGDNATVLGFSWSNCGTAADPVQIKSLSLSPDPIKIPGEETVAFDAIISETIQSFTSLSLVIKKKILGFFIEVPCVDNLGSCTYKSPCDMLKKIQCPPAFKEHGISCTCPVKKGEFKLPASLIKIPKISLPSFIESGEYKISATFMSGSKQMACYAFDASLQAD